MPSPSLWLIHRIELELFAVFAYVNVDIESSGQYVRPRAEEYAALSELYFLLAEADHFTAAAQADFSLHKAPPMAKSPPSARTEGVFNAVPPLVRRRVTPRGLVG